MKRGIKTAVLLIIMAVFLVGCESKPDEVAQKMIDDINAIGEVTLDDEDTINNLISTYSTLTDKQKESVNNYDTLLKAKDSLDVLIKKKNEEEQKQKEKEQAELETKLNEKHMKFALIIAKEIRGKLSDPTSFKLLEMAYSDFKNGSICYLVQYSGVNKQGGNADTYVIAITPSSDADLGILYTTEEDSNFNSTLTGINRAIKGDAEAKALGYSEGVYMDVDFITEHMDD